MPPGCGHLPTAMNPRIDQAIARTEAFFQSLGASTRLADFGIPAAAAALVAERLAKRKVLLSEHHDLAQGSGGNSRAGVVIAPAKNHVLHFGFPRSAVTSQSLIVLSQLPEANVLPSGLNATEVTRIECPASVNMHLPVAASQSLTVLSSLPEARCFPSGLNATEVTRSECPASVPMHLPVAASQSLTVLSSLPEARRFPSGLNATEVTRIECPASVPMLLPVATSQSLIVVSQQPAAKIFPFGLNATELAQLWPSLMMALSFPVATSDNLIWFSVPHATRRDSVEARENRALANSVPSGLRATDSKP